MKKTKILLSLLLIVMALAVIASFASCGSDGDSSSGGENSGAETNSGSNGGSTDSTQGGTTGSTGGGTTGSTQGTTTTTQGGITSSTQGTTATTQGGTTSSTQGSGNVDTPKTQYTVRVVDKNTGKPLANVSIYIQAEKDIYAVAYARGKTDANGVFTADVEPSKAKFVCIENVPKGYVYEDFYDMGTTGVEIKIGTAIVEDHDGFNNVSFALGDVMYDFTLQTIVYDKETGKISGKPVKLSELFANGKKAVMLNFWYTTCTYCIEEFPYIQAVYEKYGEEIEIIGINAYPSDSESNMMSFLNNFAAGGYGEACALTFPMAKDTLGIQNAFGFTVNPCTVIIDRYGVVSMIQVGGVMGERYFDNAIKHYIGSEYEQELYSSIYDLSPLTKPDIEMSPESEIKDAVVNGDINITFKPETDGEDAEYAWPFIVVEKDGKPCIASTNMDLDGSYAILYANVELKAGQGIMFDYLASTENYNDVLYILVNGRDIYTISGTPLMNEDGTYAGDPWRACCPWVATEDGVYEVAFCYIKDESDYYGEDRVYLDNFRVVDAESIDVETYIPRYAATNRENGFMYKNYVEVFLNEADGYYHVGSVDGPILLASLTGSNTLHSLMLPESSRYTIATKLAEVGSFMVDGVEKYHIFFDLYCNYATNSRLYGYCPVTEELRGYLDEFAKQYSAYYDENSWMLFCSYYDAYGTDVQLDDPIKGLAPFSAFDAIVTPEGEKGYLNTVTYTQIIMPRGYLYKFVPTKSGVYRITSKSSQEVNGWVFTGTLEQWINENGGDRILYMEADIGERYCPELLVDLNGDGVYERDYTNCSMINYFEAGQIYYIDIAYYDVYGAGTFTFDLKYVGESFDVFEEASMGVFTYDELSSEIIAGGINVAICTDENDPRYGYYCHLLPNGTLGSIVYADFHYTTNIFGDMSIEQLIESGAFNMFMTEIDRTAYVYKVNYYDKGGIEALEQLWGDSFEENMALYQMEDVINGIYHGEGPDYTEAMRAYIAKMDDGKNGGETVVYPERQGCVPVDAALAKMLQALMDKFTFEGVEHSWTKLCYYYKSLGEPATVESLLAELDAMVKGANVANSVLKAEIDELYNGAKELVEAYSIVSVKRAVIENAMTEIYKRIQIDIAESENN